MKAFARTSDGPPKDYVLDIEADGVTNDLSTVTSAAFHVRRPDGTTTTWDATRSNQTATTLRLTHVYTDGVFPMAGPYVIYAELTVPNGTLPTDPRELTVLDRFDTTR